jgi:hypothetical protein
VNIQISTVYRPKRHQSLLRNSKHSSLHENSGSLRQNFTYHPTLHKCHNSLLWTASLEAISIFLEPGDDSSLLVEQRIKNGKALTVDNRRSTLLLSIFSSTKLQKYAERRDIVRETYLSIDDPRLCTVNEYKRQVDENPQHVHLSSELEWYV